MGNSTEEMKPRKLVGSFGRTLLLAGTLAMLLLSAAVACGGDGARTTERDEVDVVMSTFTPTSEADAANRDATHSAQETSLTETATYVADNPPPPPPTRDPNATVAPQPTVVPNEEGLRPPFAWLSDGSEELPGALGNFGFFDQETSTVAHVLVPFIDVGDDGLTVAAGGELQFLLQEDVQRPSSMSGDPKAMSMEIYTWEDNSAIPTGTDGSIEERPWFIPRVKPVISGPLHMDAARVVMPAQPDRYVVRVEVTWPTGSDADNPQQVPIYATYVFTVYVS